MRVVANTTPIISLASIGQLHLLERLFGRVLIAEAVYDEIKAKPGYGFDQIDHDFIKSITISSKSVQSGVSCTSACCSINWMPARRRR